MNKPKFISEPNCIYHIYNRGVEKRKIFLDDQDYFRFIHDLFEFNDEALAVNLYYKQSNFKSYEVQPRKIKRKPRKLIVEILAFCLMPNHFHLLLRQSSKDGIVKFMHKLGTGYSMYFNGKYERVGGLFQGRFKAILIDNETYFLYLPYYIHSNPLDLIMPNWKEEGIRNWREAKNFLEDYRWSSHFDYIGKKNFPSVTQRDFLLKVFGSDKEYMKGIERWLKDLDLEDIEDFTLE